MKSQACQLGSWTVRDQAIDFSTLVRQLKLSLRAVYCELYIHYVVNMVMKR